MSLYIEHFRLREAPFRITPTTDFFYHGGRRGEILDALLYSVSSGEGIMLVTGEVGSGKTMLLRALSEKVPDNIELVYIPNPSLSGREILFNLCGELGLSGDSERPDTLRRLQDYLIAKNAEGKQVLALIDEAQAMPEESLEEIRLLSNLETRRHKLMQVILFGQPELDDTLAKQNMRQLRERVTVRFRLEPLGRGDVMEYIQTRLRAAGHQGGRIFSEDACALIARVSQGLSRRINILADKSLLSAFARGARKVGLVDARRAVRDAGFRKLRYVPARARRRIAQGARALAATAIAALLIAGGIRFWRQNEAAAPLSPPSDEVVAAAIPLIESESESAPDSNQPPIADSPAPIAETTPDSEAVDFAQSVAEQTEAIAAASVALVEPVAEDPAPDLIDAENSLALTDAQIEIEAVDAALESVAALESESEPASADDSFIEESTPAAAIDEPQTPRVEEVAEAIAEAVADVEVAAAVAEVLARDLTPQAPSSELSESLESPESPAAANAAADESPPPAAPETAVESESPAEDSPPPESESESESEFARTNESGNIRWHIETEPTAAAPAIADNPKWNWMPPDAFLRERLNVTQTRLQSPPGSYTGRLMTVAQERATYLERFLRHFARFYPLRDVMVYPLRLDAGDHFVVTYGFYDERLEAEIFLRNLPYVFSGGAPYAQTVAESALESAPWWQ